MKTFRYYHIIALLALTLAAAACSSDNDPETPAAPIEITATGDTAFTLWSASGTVSIPLTVANATEPLKAEDFHITSITAADGVEPEVKIASLTPSDAGYTLAVSYSAGDAQAASFSFTVGYADTDIALPVTIECRDAFSISTSFAAVGAIASLRLERNEGIDIPESANIEIVKAEAIGIHAADVAFSAFENSECTLEVKSSFAHTAEEIEAGYAAVPVQVTMKDGESEFMVNGIFNVCPASIIAQETVTASESRHVWMLPDQLGALGLDKTGDQISLIGRKVQYFIARKGEPLVPIKESDLGVGGGAGERHHWDAELEQDFVYPAIYLMKANNLPAGEYVFVAHIKKLMDTQDDRWVDVVMPVVK